MEQWSNIRVISDLPFQGEAGDDEPHIWIQRTASNRSHLA